LIRNKHDHRIAEVRGSRGGHPARDLKRLSPETSGVREKDEKWCRLNIYFDHIFCHSNDRSCLTYGNRNRRLRNMRKHSPVSAKGKRGVMW